MSIEKHKAFLDSLEPEKGLPEGMHGWRFSTDIDDFGIDDYAELDGAHFQNNFVAYLMERVRRAESRQIPDLKEKVKELMRDAMEVTRNRYKDCVGLGKTYADYEDFVELCESDKGQEVKP